jgi:N-acetyl-anhydromuramyl-L-alanine amidase AmpD
MPKKEKPMARLVQREFDPARPVCARKYFTAAGRKYVPGDAFDWRKLAVSQRRVLQMFDAGKLMHKVEEDKWNATDADFEDNDIQAYIEAEISKLDGYEPEVINEEYDLDAIDDMKELRRIADEIGAPYKVSKADQRQAIRDHKEMM